jgi:hypothetical protein
MITVWAEKLSGIPLQLWKGILDDINAEGPRTPRGGGLGWAKWAPCRRLWADEHRVAIYNVREVCYIQGGECNPDGDLALLGG